MKIIKLIVIILVSLTLSACVTNEQPDTSELKHTIVLIVDSQTSSFEVPTIHTFKI